MGAIRSCPRVFSLLQVFGLFVLGELALAEIGDEKGFPIPTIHTLSVNSLHYTNSADFPGVPIDVTLHFSTPMTTQHITPFTQNAIDTLMISFTAPEIHGDYQLSGWYEGPQQLTTNNTITFAASGDRTLSARYAIQYRTLQVMSEPDDDALIAFPPNDFVRTPTNLGYPINYTATLSAEATHNGRPFARWLKDGEPFSASPDIELIMDDHHTVVAEYGTGLLKVQIRPKLARQSGAKWRVDGGKWRKHNKIVEGLLIGGGHVVEFKPVPGMKTPKPKTVSIGYNLLTTTNGRYKDQ